MQMGKNMINWAHDPIHQLPESMSLPFDTVRVQASSEHDFDPWA